MKKTPKLLVLFAALALFSCSKTDDPGPGGAKYYMKGIVDGKAFSWDLTDLLYYSIDTGEPCGSVCLYGAGYYEADDGDPSTLYNGKRIIIYTSSLDDFTEPEMMAAFQPGAYPVCSTVAGGCASIVFTPADGSGSYQPDYKVTGQKFKVISRSGVVNAGTKSYIDVKIELEMSLESIIQDRNDRIESLRAEMSLPIYF